MKTKKTMESWNCDFFGIPESVMLDSTRIKVIDGIAGAGKSSILHKWLVDHGLGNYRRLTSTRMLAADAAKRYNMPVQTVASGLFATENLRFYQNPRDINGETIVIDEILQTSPEVFVWCLEHCGDNNIFVTCDRRQCLSPVIGGLMEQRYLDFVGDKRIYLTEITQTLRGRDPDTVRFFNRAYDMVYKNTSLYKDILNNFPCLSYAEIEYNPYDVFICYTNADEKRLYDDYHLRDAYYLRDLLVPKGALIGTEKQYANAERYPIVPQIDAEHATSYWQLENVSSVIRLQGTEIDLEQKCYILVPDGMVMDNRSLYTAITRCKSIQSIRFVTTPRGKTEELIRYNDKPVYTATWYFYSDNYKIGDTPITALINDDGTCDPDLFAELVSRIPRDNEAAYMTDAVIVGDTVVRPRYNDTDNDSIQPIGVYKLFARAGLYEYSYLPELYRLYEKVQHEYGIVKASPYLIPPTLRGLDAIGTNFDAADDYYRLKPRSDYQYQLDLASAYPYILAHFPVVCDGNFLVNESAPGMRLYVSFSDYFPEGAIVPDYLAKIITSGNRHHHVDFRYLCTVPFVAKCKQGGRLWELSNRTKEDKLKVKSIRWGCLEKPYLQDWQYDTNGQPLSYACTPGNNKQLIMLSIRAALAYILIKLKDVLLLDIAGGYTQADALFYNSDYTVDWQAQLIETVCPGLHWRIIDNHDDEILHKNFVDPLSCDDRRRLKARERYRQKKLTLKS